MRTNSWLGILGDVVLEVCVESVFVWCGEICALKKYFSGGKSDCGVIDRNPGNVCIGMGVTSGPVES